MHGHNQSHAWVELWFPKTGWVPYEPQGSAAFADSHHLRSWVGMDCDTAKPLLRWQGYSRTDVTYHESVEVTHLSDQPNLTYVSRAEAPAGVILLSRRQSTQDCSSRSPDQSISFTPATISPVLPISMML